MVAKYQRQVFSTAFKKEFSVLNNSINYLNLQESLRECYTILASCPTETNPDNKCYKANTSDCKALKDRLISDLKMIPVNKSDFVYAKRDDVLASGGTSTDRTASFDAIYSMMSSYSLPDGAVVIFYNPQTPTDSYALTSFVVDVNGRKGPNKWGYDVFWLTISLKNESLRLTDEWSTISEKGGSLPRNILLNKWSNEYEGKLW